jgi:hypothetical protein
LHVNIEYLSYAREHFVAQALHQRQAANEGNFNNRCATARSTCRRFCSYASSQGERHTFLTMIVFIERLFCIADVLFEAR